MRSGRYGIKATTDASAERSAPKAQENWQTPVDFHSTRAIDEGDRGPFRHAPRNAFGIPIREAHAAVGLGLGYLPRRRGAVDAVTLGGKIDPDRAHRIVRTGFDREGFAGMNALEMILGIVVISRIVVDCRHLQGAGRRRFLFASDGRRVKTDQRIRLVEQLHGLPALVDFDTLRLDRIFRRATAGIHDDDRIAGTIELLSGIEHGKQLLAHVKSFRQFLPRAGEAEPRKVRHVLHPRRKLTEERPRDVLFGDGVMRGHRPVVLPKLAPNILGDDIGAGQPMRFAVGAQRLLRVLSEFAIDLAGREMRAIQQDLEPNGQGGRPVGWQSLSRSFGCFDRGRTHFGSESSAAYQDEDQRQVEMLCFAKRHALKPSHASRHFRSTRFSWPDAVAAISFRYWPSYSRAIRCAEKRSSNRARTRLLSSRASSLTALTASCSLSTMKPVTPSSMTSGTEPER